MPKHLATVIYWSSRGVSLMSDISEEEARRRKKAHKEAMRICKKLTRLNQQGKLNKSTYLSIKHSKADESGQKATSGSKRRVFWKHELDAKRTEEEAKATQLQSKAGAKTTNGTHTRKAKRRARSDAELAMHKATPTLRGSMLHTLGKNEAQPVNKDALKEFYRSHTRSKKHKKRRAKRRK
jgi:hypothetical protein